MPISATKTSVPSARCSFTALASPARLLKLAGLATTETVPDKMYVMACLVLVFP